MKDKKFIYGNIIAVAFLLTAGLTYAYFSLTVSGNDVAETINVSTTKIELIYTDGKEIKVDSIEPKWTTTKTITVENTGNEEAYYALGWQKLYNEIQKEELVIRSTCTSSGVTGGTCDNTDDVVIPETTEVTAEANKVIYPYKENVKILPGEKHTYTVTIEFINYDDKAQNYNQGKRFYGVLGAAESSEKIQTLSNYIINNYQTLGLTKIDQETTGNQNYDTTEYRYQGKNPNNYIAFNGEENTWRIIGVFEVETPNGDGTYTKEYKVKIVKNKIGNAAWDYKTSSGYNDNWTVSTLMTMLNIGPYYNRTSGYTKLACSTGYETTISETAICNYESNGLTSEAKNQISSTKWYLGNVVEDGNDFGTAKEIYAQERSISVHSGNKQTWDGKVALIYPSDYMYASSACYNDDTMKGYNSSDLSKSYSDEVCTSTNWLLNATNRFWTMSPSSRDSSLTTCVHDVGYLYHEVTSNISIGLRQSVYLDSSVKYIEGDGTSENQFVIE